MPYDLFISYSRRDNEQGRITQLVERIKTDFAPFEKRELVPFFDQQEIHGMSDWRQRILQGLRESRLLLACLSPAYLQSEYCEWEFVEYLKYEIGHLHGFNGVAPIYFVEVPGWDSKDFEHQCTAWVAELRKRQQFDLRPWHDQGEEALRETAVQERMGKLNHQIAQTITRGERAEKSLGNVDAHNPHFIGRIANLRVLRDNFVRPGHIGVVTAVNGVGGLGKTALAIEYAHAFADEYGGGRWQVRCAGKDDLRLALAELATPIGFEFTDDEKKNADLQFERTRRELKKLADASAPHRCLLLLDNVDRPGLLDPAQVARLNGGDWLHVLATTRLGENELHGAHRDRSFLAIDELPPDDALALIESYQPDGRFRSEAERDAAREIVRLLGCFTLAVESAAVYLGQFANDVTCAAFLARLKKEGLEGLDTAASQSSEGVLHGEKHLSATLQPTLERLGTAEKLALEFAALLPPDQVPLPWLRALVAKTFPEMERDAEPGYPDPWNNVTRRLVSLRLFQITNVTDPIGQPRVVRMHRLVGELLCTNAVPHQGSLHDEVFSYIQARSRELQQVWYENVWEISALVAYARQLTDWRDNNAVAMVRSLCQWLPEYDYGRDSEPMLRACLGQLEDCPSHDPSDLPVTLSNLGWALDMLGRQQEAEKYLRRALEIDERERPEDKHSLAVRCNNLQACLRDQGRLSEAEPYCRRALELSTQALGGEHPDTVVCLGWLANLLWKKGDHVEAERLMRRALATTERTLGFEHPTVGRDLRNLAVLLRTTNRSAEAEPLLRRALAIYEKSVGSEHPLIARTLTGLAKVLRKTGRLEESEIICKQALEIEEKTLGLNHPNTADSLETLAGLLEATGRYEEAETFLRKAEIASAKILGDINPLTIHRHNNLVLTLILLGKLEEARQILAANWRLNAPPHANTTPRIAFLRHLIALLESQPDTPFLGQLKTLLTGPELPVASDVAVPWDIAYFIEFLKPKLGEHHAEFLTALVAALDNRTKLSALDSFPEWRNQPPTSLDAIWPD